MRLIDADALPKFPTMLRKMWSGGEVQQWIKENITNAPTVQREGWVRVEELQKVYDDMFKHKDIAISANSLFKLIQAAPTDTE